MALGRLYRWTKRSAALVGAIGLPGILAGQESNAARYDVGVGLGVFADYPSAFAAGSCRPINPGGLTAFLRRSAGAFVSVEGMATVTGAAGAACADALIAAPRDGEIITRTFMDDHLGGETFFATELAAVLHPMRKRRLAPRLRIGAGRLWDKRLWHWTYGAGARLRLGSHAIAFDVQRWNLGYDIRREQSIYRDSGAHELQSVETVRQSPRPWQFRLSWERRIG